MAFQTKTNTLFALLLTTIFALTTVGCGEDPDTSDEGANNGGSANNGGGGTATCTTACDVLVGNSCAGVTSQAECEAACQQSFTSELINCVSSSATCADADQCVEDGGGNNGDNNGGGEDGKVGSDCSSNSQCDSAFCKTPAGGDRGMCVVNDFGDSCQGQSDCEYGACVVRPGGNDDFGYCTSACESFADCPTFWDCEELNNAAGTYCIQG